MTKKSQDASLFSKCNEKFLLTATVGLVIFCFTATITALVPIFQVVLLCPDRSSPDSLVISIYWGAAIFLLSTGVATLLMLVYFRKTGTISNLHAVTSRAPTAD